MEFTQKMFNNIEKIEVYICHQCGDDFSQSDLHWVEYSSTEYQVEGAGYTCAGCIRDEELEKMEQFKRGPTLHQVLDELCLRGELAKYA